MRTPYQWFVALVARLVNGEYPAHYDTRIRRRIRLVLGLPTVGLTYFAFQGTPRSLSTGIPRAVLFTPRGLTIAAASALVVLLVWAVAKQRTASLEQHVLRTNTTAVLVDDGYSVTDDVLRMFDYIKVFGVLVALYSLPFIADLFIATPVIVRRAALILAAVRAYYFFLLINFALPVLLRWTRIHLTNNADTTPTNDT